MELVPIEWAEEVGDAWVAPLRAVAPGAPVSAVTAAAEQQPTAAYTFRRRAVDVAADGALHCVPCDPQALQLVARVVDVDCPDNEPRALYAGADVPPRSIAGAVEAFLTPHGAAPQRCRYYASVFDGIADRHALDVRSASALVAGKPAGLPTTVYFKRHLHGGAGHDAHVLQVQLPLASVGGGDGGGFTGSCYSEPEASDSSVPPPPAADTITPVTLPVVVDHATTMADLLCQLAWWGVAPTRPHDAATVVATLVAPAAPAARWHDGERFFDAHGLDAVVVGAAAWSTPLWELLPRPPHEPASPNSAAVWPPVAAAASGGGAGTHTDAAAAAARARRHFAAAAPASDALLVLAWHAP